MFRSDGVREPIIRFPTLQYRNFLREFIARPSEGGTPFLVMQLLLLWGMQLLLFLLRLLLLLQLLLLLPLLLPLRLLLLPLLPFLLLQFLLLLNRHGTRSGRSLPPSWIPMMTVDSVIFRGSGMECRRCFRMVYLRGTMK